MMLDPKWLEQTVAAAKAAKEGTPQALPCHKCGYDLRGVPPGKPCPECGTPVLRTLAPGGRMSGLKRLLMAPSEQLRVLALAGWLFGPGFTVFAGGMLVAWVCGFLRVIDWADASRSLQTVATGAALLGAMAWAGGLWLMTGMPLAKVGEEAGATDIVFVPRRSRTLVWMVRAAGFMLPIGVGLTLLSTWADAKSYLWADSARIWAMLAVMAALIGAGAAAVVLREAAITLEDDFAANMMLWGSWAFPAAGIYCGSSALAGPYFNWGMGLMNLTGLGYSAVMLPLPFMLVAGIWSLGTTCRWASTHAERAMEKDREFREKAEAAGRERR